MGQAKILMVDDTAANIQLLSDALRPEWSVLVAMNGEDALSIAAESRPDLILLDVQMPGLDGFEVCRRLKADPALRDIPVIFVTAYDDEDDEALGLALGAVDYITKPVRASIVRARVRNHLELKRQRDLLRDLATTDGLTGIANRRRFDEALDAEWRRCQRRAVPLSVIMGDVDRFKAFNDAHGHLAGDDCLRGVAKAFADMARRPGDLAARYGGEEFVLLLPDTDAAAASRLAEALRRAVAATAIACDGVVSHVTVSLGVATTVPTAGGAAEALVGAADRMLYQAKQAGRNRIESEVLA